MIKQSKSILGLFLGIVLFTAMVPVTSVAAASSWQQAYIDYIQANFSSSKTDDMKFSLIYVDSDEIPELYVVGNSLASGDRMCTYQNGSVNELNCYNYGTSYVERGNLFNRSGGHMDVYFDYIYTIENGEFVLLHNGDYGAENNAHVQLDANGYPIYNYYWDDKLVSKDEYEAFLYEAYEKYSYIDASKKSYSRSEIINIIEEYNSSSQSDIISCYAALIQSAENSNQYSVYSLYDFDCDGILELIIDNNESHNTRVIDFYKYDNGLVSMGSYKPSYGTLCKNPNGSGIILYYALRNHEWLELLTYNAGIFTSESITESREVYYPDTYKEPYEILDGAYYLETCNTSSDNLLKEALENNRASEGQGISVTLNGNNISFDQAPIIVNDRVLVPIRAIFEAMGYTVTWNESTQTAAAVNGSNKITVKVGSSIISYTTDGKSGTYTCDVAPQIVSDRILVPVRAIAESAGCNVAWDENNRTVIITYDESVIRGLLLAGYDNDTDSDVQKNHLDANRLSVDYVEEALNHLNIYDIEKHYMENDNKYMSADEFSELLNKTFRNAKDDDLSVIYYSGHSFYYTDSYGNNIGHSTAFSNYTFQEFYNLIKEKVSGTVLLMYDGCYAGELMNLNNYDDRIKIIAACDEDDYSSSYYLSEIDATSSEKQLCSIFAYALYNGVINNMNYLDSDNDKVITFDELYVYLLNSVYNIGDRITTQKDKMNRLKDMLGLDNAVRLAQIVQSYPDNDTTPLFRIN